VKKQRLDFIQNDEQSRDVARDVQSISVDFMIVIMNFNKICGGMIILGRNTLPLKNRHLLVKTIIFSTVKIL
jgi:hypothetical protein